MNAFASRSSLFASALLIAACALEAPEQLPGEALGAAADESMLSDDKPEDPCKKYPISVVPTAGAEALARDALAILAPSATMTWSAARGAPSSLQNMALSFGCAPGDDVGAELLALMADHPEVFAIDPGQWELTPIPCEAVDGPNLIVSALRTSYAGLDSTDSFAVIIGRGDSKAALELRTMVGYYLPPPSDALVGMLERCPDLPEQKGTEAALSHAYPFSIFDSCALVGESTYKPSTGDEVSFGAHSWEWEERATHVELFKRVEAELLVSPAHHNPKLLASDANCPWGTVGFEVRFDAVLGKIRETDPGIGNCIVCAAP